MVLCLCAIVIGRWILLEDVMERIPRIIKVSLV
jgi:hypothetical protein